LKILDDLLFVTEESGVRNLRREGVSEDRIHLVGNVMIDSLLRYRTLAERSAILDELRLRADGGSTRPFGLMTLHRPSNVDDPKVLGGILEAVDSIAETLPVFFPVHPRTRERMESFGLGRYFKEGDTHHSGLVPFRSLGYLEFLCLMDHARLVLTDSGGVQEETTALGVPCLTLRENTERPATIEQGTNQLVGSDPTRLIAAARKVLGDERGPGSLPPLWDGHAASRIVEIILERFGVHR
jgi:UDP-N-acetylglucosamine 2-epimerase (non-hydrolysing)